MADLDTGEILAAKSPHAWLRPASTLKTLTALTLMPRLDPRRVVVASQDAQAAAGSRVGILAGNRYPVGRLFDAMLMFSANDAAYALADAAGGYDAHRGPHERHGRADSVRTTPSPSTRAVSTTATSAPAPTTWPSSAGTRCGCRPSGPPSRSATPSSRAARTSTGKVWPAFHIYNINELLRHYPGAIGIKPGRTNRAQHTFIGAATRDGRTLVVAQMGSVTGSWKPTAALLDWGFANADQVTPVGGSSSRARPPPDAAAVVPDLPTGGAAGTDRRRRAANGHTGARPGDRGDGIRQDDVAGRARRSGLT